jgi:CDP-diacylglycerol--glycerol-3-phosphate 3-phosphatidyltransferase
MISVFLFVMDSFVAAGVTFLIGSLFDVLDGELARTGHRVTSFGSVLDSILDRFSEGIVLIAFAWYFADRGETVGVVITMLGMLGSIATSYVRARAEAIGTTCTVGWVTRSERVLIIAVGMFSGQIFLAVSILFLVTTLTVIQRVLHVRSLLVQKDKVSSDKLYDE